MFEVWAEYEQGSDYYLLGSYKTREEAEKEVDFFKKVTSCHAYIYQDQGD